MQFAIDTTNNRQRVRIDRRKPGSGYVALALLVLCFILFVPALVSADSPLPEVCAGVPSCVPQETAEILQVPREDRVSVDIICPSEAPYVWNWEVQKVAGTSSNSASLVATRVLFLEQTPGREVGTRLRFQNFDQHLAQIRVLLACSTEVSPVTTVRRVAMSLTPSPSELSPIVGGHTHSDTCQIKQPNGSTFTIPECQESASIKKLLGTDDTDKVHMTCPANAPYYWGHYDYDGSSWISLTPDPFSTAFAPFLVTNWDPITNHSYTLFIACSAANPDGCGASATPGAFLRDGLGGCTDPNCPVADKEQRCAGSGPNKQCWDVWNEVCIDNTTNPATVTNYFCTDALFAACCTRCEAGAPPLDTSPAASVPVVDTRPYSGS